MTTVWAAQAAEFIQYDGTNLADFQDPFGVEPEIDPVSNAVTFTSDANVVWDGVITIQVGDWVAVGWVNTVTAADFATKYVPVPQP